MTATTEVYILAALRTPFAKAHPQSGYFRLIRADDLAAGLVRALLARVAGGVTTPSVAEATAGSAVEFTAGCVAAVDEIFWGCVKQQGEQGFNLARTVGLLAGLAPSVAAATVNRACASGLEAVRQAALAVASGQARLVIAGGVEHLHHVPMDPVGVTNPRLGDRFSPAVQQMGRCAEYLARRYGISRAEQDAFAHRSHQLAARAQAIGALATQIAPTRGHDAHGWPTLLTHDQCIRTDTTPETLAALTPAFCDDGTGSVTAGNSCPLSVGAAAVLVGGAAVAREFGLTPLARLRSVAVVGTTPALMGIAPVAALTRACERADLHPDSLDFVEINEAFAVQVLACLRELPIELSRLNTQGGALALGHPLAATGARLIGSVALRLHEGEGRYAAVAMCVGGGQGMAMVLERVAGLEQIG